MPEDTPEPKKNDKLEKIKTVVKNNWKPFTVGVVFAGVTLAVTRKVYIGTLIANSETVATNRSLISILSPQLAKAITIRAEIGRPPYLIHDLTTDLYYGSQSAAAKALNASNTNMSLHLNGLRDHVKDHVLERIYPEV